MHHYVMCIRGTLALLMYLSIHNHPWIDSMRTPYITWVYHTSGLKNNSLSGDYK